MKKKVLLSSIATIVLCLCLIAGSTFALFTSRSETNIAVTAGEVNMEASLTVTKLESVTRGGDGTIVDENGASYKYTEVSPNFTNGGTAKVDGSVLTVDKITPGDRVTIQIDGANKSNVAVQYRYVIQCVDGEELMKGLVVTAGGKAYKALASYTSAWTPLAVGDNMAAATVSIELPVTAGNEYQKKTAKINVIVEAVQGNAAVDTSVVAMVEFLDGVYDMSGAVISDSVVNNGEITINNGKIEVEDVGFENYGSAVLDKVEMNAGSPSDYGFRGIGEDSVTVLNDVNFVSGGGAIGAANGATVTFNSGEVEVGSAATSGRYLFYAEGENTVITINDGDFSVADKLSNGTNQNNKRAYICAIDGATVYVTGGTFGKAPFRNAVVFSDTNSRYSDGIVTNKTGTVIITGGTFGFDPTTWVAAGHKATKIGSQWIVTPESVNAVATSDSLVEALEGGKDVLMMDDVKIEPAGMSNAYGTTGINVKNGQTIDGNGHVLDIKGAGGTWDSGINTTGGLIKNITVTGSFRGIFINHNSTHAEKVVLENVILDGTTYTISCDQGKNQGLEATNSTFNGWTSYAATLGEAKFVDCSFGEGNGYAFCRPYAPTEFVGCDFEAGFQIDARAAVTFENCTIGGVELTAENLATLVTYNTANASVK